MGFAAERERSQITKFFHEPLVLYFTPKILNIIFRCNKSATKKVRICNDTQRSFGDNRPLWQEPKENRSRKLFSEIFCKGV